MSDEPEVCPECGSRALNRPTTSPPWCIECEWNLAAYPPPLRGKSTRLARFSHRVAFRLNRSLYDELIAGPPPKPSWTRARVFLILVSLLLLAATLTGVVGGLLLLFGHQFGLRIVGFFLVLIGLELRPRWPRWKVEFGIVARTDAPDLYALVDEISDHLHAPRVTTIAVDEHWNASCGRRGLRREPTLVIGLPLWAALSPAGRLALLGHELGHLINADPARGILTEPALVTFSRVSDLFDPRHLVRAFSGQVAFIGWLGGMLAQLVFTPIWWMTRWIQLLLWMIASRDHQRAEIYADAIALRLAGSEGATELFDALMLATRLETAVSRSARRGEAPSEWHEHAAQARADAQHKVRVLEQASLRGQASLFATHPPSGMRRRLGVAWPTNPPSDLIDSPRWTAIDASLPRQYERVRRALHAR